MDSLYNSNPYVNKQEEDEFSPENGQESPPSAAFNDCKIASTSSPKKSRRAIQKRVVSIPIKDAEGSRLKGEGAPPYDSWAWRKYGQKPIKGSPYPRGYYRCSSSKGCPARKQVERSRVDPTMLVVTYSCEHNHTWPASRNNHHATSSPAAAITPPPPPSPPEKPTVSLEPDLELEGKFADLGEESLITTDELSWFADMESTSSTMLESTVFAEERSVGDTDMTMFFPMREEDESLFADLGELPECSVVFRRGMFWGGEEERRRYTAPPWCGTTS
uniref:Putative WRKY transcription factor 65 n=1 Tax=Paeonia lactiflora TaxID=35924 RepID=A0A2P0W755_PAELC|nr:putative WRKY transcription factor 65 [Paeonia lactiflora]